MTERLIRGRTAQFEPLVQGDDRIIHQKRMRESGLEPLVIPGDANKHGNIPSSAFTNTRAGIYSGRLHDQIYANFEGMHQHIQAERAKALAAGDHARVAQIDGWQHFYPQAHDATESRAPDAGVSVTQMRGVTAISSGGMDWKRNVDSAHNLIEGIRQGRPTHELSKLIRAGGEGVNAAAHVMTLSDQGVKDFMDRYTKYGPFFHGLNDPHNMLRSGVYDKHMMDLAYGWNRNWARAGADYGVSGDPRTAEGRRASFIRDIGDEWSRDHGMAPLSGQAYLWGGKKDVTDGMTGSPTPTSPAFEQVYPDVRVPSMYRRSRS